jgi:hypothetical protein
MTQQRVTLAAVFAVVNGQWVVGDHPDGHEAVDVTVEQRLPT